jgi:hypothetical protein
MCLEQDEARCELDRNVPRILLYCVLHLAGGGEISSDNIRHRDLVPHVRVPFCNLAVTSEQTLAVSLLLAVFIASNWRELSSGM